MRTPKVLKTNVLYRGRIFNLVVEDVEFPTGVTSIREIVQHNGGAVIVPLFANGDVLLVRQYRSPHKQFVLELPAGKLEINENPLECARRELREETGYEADNFEHLTSIMTTPGFCSEVLHIFLARDIRPSRSGQLLEEEEHSLTVEQYPLQEALSMVERGDIVDGKTICGLFLAERRLRTGLSQQ
ncbi:MAG: NUDIX hydrolase [Bacteroidetes bacterium]|nr:NUDIX hydrolase [Bacteroidota bacterium]